MTDWTSQPTCSALYDTQPRSSQRGWLAGLAARANIADIESGAHDPTVGRLDHLSA